RRKIVSVCESRYGTTLAAAKRSRNGPRSEANRSPRHSVRRIVFTIYLWCARIDAREPRTVIKTTRVVNCSIAHRFGNAQGSADGLGQAFQARCNVRGVPNRSKLQLLRRTDAPHNGRAGMNSNSNLYRRALVCCMLVIQTINSAQNFTARRHSIAA